MKERLAQLDERAPMQDLKRDSLNSATLGSCYLGFRDFEKGRLRERRRSANHIEPTQLMAEAIFYEGEDEQDKREEECSTGEGAT